MSEQQILPEEGEVVICTVREITPHGIYVNLDQYDGMNGFLHISEISTGWVRSIEKVAKPQQKLVLKVIRADRARNEIDLSLRQVTNEERRSKVIEWKRAERANAIMSIVRKKTNLDDKQMSGYVEKMEKEFGSLYDALETSTKKGENALAEIGIPSSVAHEIVETAKEKIVSPKYEVGAIVEVTSKASDGVQQIKKALISASNASSGAEVKITYVGAPRYRVRIVADDYKQAEKSLNSALEKIRDSAGKHGTFNFKREISRKYGGVS